MRVGWVSPEVGRLSWEKANQGLDEPGMSVVGLIGLGQGLINVEGLSDRWVIV